MVTYAQRAELERTGQERDFMKEVTFRNFDKFQKKSRVNELLTMAEMINHKTDPYENWFLFTLMYLIIDYCRPQDIFSPLAYLRPGMVANLILTGFLISRGKLKEAPGKQIKMIWLFIGLLALYIPFAVNNYYAYKTTKDMILYMPFILSTTICVNSIDRLKKLIYLTICILIYVSLYSLAHQGMGSGNYFQDENDVSLYVNMWIPFCFFLFLIAKEKSKKIIYLTGLILGILTVIVSFSRGGFVGLVVVLFVCWLYGSKKKLSLVAIGVLAIVTLTFASGSYWQRISTVKDIKQGTAAERIESWKAGWRMFLDNPWGVGGNNFPVQFEKYQSGWFKKGMWGRVAHSIWFTLIPELGITGLIIYLSLLRYNIKDIIFLKKLKEDGNHEDDRRYFHALSGAFVASLAGYFASGTFLSVLYYPHYWYLTGIIIATANAAKKLNLDDNKQTVQNHNWPS